MSALIGIPVPEGVALADFAGNAGEYLVLLETATGIALGAVYQ